MRQLVPVVLLVAPAIAGDASAWRELEALLDIADDDLAAGRDVEAEASYRRAAELAPSFGSSNLFLARALDGLGDVERRRGRFAEAEGFYLRSLELWRALLGAQQPRVATTLHHLGLVCGAAGEREEAVGHLRQALVIWESRLGVDSEEAANTRRALASLEK